MESQAVNKFPHRFLKKENFSFLLEMANMLEHGLDKDLEEAKTP
jgi:hypothetical protein